MIRERDDRGTYTQDHRRMNLTVGESDSLSSWTMQIFQTHGDHSRLFLINIYEFDESFLAACLKIPWIIKTAYCGIDLVFV